MDFLDMLKIVSTISSSFLTIFAFMGAIITYKAKAKGGIEKMFRDLVGIDRILEELRNSADNLKKQTEVSFKLQKAIVCVLRKDINELCEQCILKGYVTYDELEMITQEFESYVMLDGNSFIHGLVDNVKKLPMKIDD